MTNDLKWSVVYNGRGQIWFHTNFDFNLQQLILY